MHQEFTEATGVPVYFCDPKVHDKEVQTKIQTSFYGNIFQRKLA